MGAYVGDLQVRGTLKPDKFDPPTNCIDAASIETAAGIEATKLQQQVYMEHRQAHGSAVVDKRETVHIATGATGELVEIYATLPVKCVTGATITVMLKKNGSDILSAALQLDDADANYAVVYATNFTSTAYVRDDVFEIVVDATAGGGTVGQGLFVRVIAREDPE